MEIKNARIARNCLMRGDYGTAEKLLDGLEDSLDPNVITAFIVLYRFYMECLDLENLYCKRLIAVEEVVETEMYDDPFTEFWTAFWDEDRELMHDLAEDGVPMAVCEMGNYVWSDEGSEEEALRYLELAADMGVSRACRIIGLIVFDENDYTVHIGWYERAAKLGNLDILDRVMITPAYYDADPVADPETWERLEKRRIYWLDEKIRRKQYVHVPKHWEEPIRPEAENRRDDIL